MRSQRGQVWPYLLLSVALVGALGFGAYQTRLKNQFIRESENKYMSAFHKLKWTSEQIEDRSARLMATNDTQLQEALLADLRVFSAQAVEHMSVLPFTTMNTPRITNFLNSLRNQSDEIHYKLSNGGTLDEKDWTVLKEFRSQAVFFESELGNLLGLVGNNIIRWTPTVRATSPAQSGNAATPITKSMMHMEQELPAPPGEENALAPGEGPLPPPRMNLGARVDQATAAANIKKFMDMPLQGEPVLTHTYDPPANTGGFPLYYFEVTKQNGLKLNFGVSINGGHIIYALDGRLVQDKRLKPQEMIAKARQFLHKWGYTSVRQISGVDNDGTYIMDFAPIENGVALETELIKVSIAMDNGELTGFDAKNYWINHRERQFQQPKLSPAEARKQLAPGVEAGQPALSLVADRQGKERLTWAFQGQVDDQRYLIYIDATDGREVNVLRVAGDPVPPMAEGQGE